MTWSTLGSGEESTGVLGEDLVILRDNRGQERVGFLRAVVESRVHLCALGPRHRFLYDVKSGCDTCPDTPFPGTIFEVGMLSCRKTS